MGLTGKRQLTGGWRQLHNEKLHDLCHTPDIIGVIKSRMMRLAGHAARMEKKTQA